MASPAAATPPAQQQVHLTQQQAHLSNNASIPFTAKMLTGIFFIAVVAGPIILALGASGIFGLVGSTGFCSSVAVGGGSVLITSWIIRNIFISYKEGQESATDADSLKNIQGSVLTFAADRLSRSLVGGMTVGHFGSLFSGDQLERPAIPQPLNNSSTPSMGRFCRTVLLDHYSVLVKDGAPRDLQIGTIDDLMRLSYVISLLTATELTIKKKRGEMVEHDQSTYYDLFRCARTYHYLKNRFVWKDPSDFYNKDSLKSQWRVFYNHLCEYIGSVVEADKMKEFGFLPFLQKDLKVHPLQANDMPL